MQQAMSLLQAQVVASRSYTPQAPVPPAQAPAFHPAQTPFFNPASRGFQGHGCSGGRGRGQRNHSIYCWTHGGCGHASNACAGKLPGHQEAATGAWRQNRKLNLELSSMP